MYGFLADAMVFLHLLYCAYVVVGQVVVMVAAPFRWGWARNPWFRYSHLLAIAIVVVEEAMGWRCPLTVWEEQLRALAGQGTQQSESFIGRLAHDTLFFDLPQVFFTTVHVAMGVVVAQGCSCSPRGGSGAGRRRKCRRSWRGCEPNWVNPGSHAGGVVPSNPRHDCRGSPVSPARNPAPRPG